MILDNNWSCNKFFLIGLVEKMLSHNSVYTNCQTVYVMKRKNQYLKIAHAVTWRFSDKQSIQLMAASLIFPFIKLLYIFFIFFFSRKQDLTLHANCLRLAWNVKSGWQFMQIVFFAWTVKFYFLGKIRKKKNQNVVSWNFNSVGWALSKF